MRCMKSLVISVTNRVPTTSGVYVACRRRVNNPLALFFFLILLIFPAKADPGDGWPRQFQRGPSTGDKYVALTIDDAPMNEIFQTLDLLEELDITATFFVEGEFADWRPDGLRAIAEAGHEIGNHSWDHPNMTLTDADDWKRQLADTNAFIESVTGITPHLFRPPGGQYNNELIDYAYELEMTTVLWTSNGSDYLRPPSDEIVSRIMGRMSPGGIILVHDGVTQTREALPVIVERLRSQGYTFVTVGEMLKMAYGECQWSDENKTENLNYDDFPGF